MIKKNNKEVGFIHSSLLPKEYQQVEYIESTGTQYIDTGILTGRFVHDISFSESNGRILMGNSGYATQFWGSSADCTYYDFYKTITLDTTERRIVEYTNAGTYGALSVNGTTKSASSPYAVNNTYMLFAINGSTPTGSPSIKLYEFWAYDNNNVLLLHMIPCYRKEDNVIGLYDLVNGEFHMNEGTGTFNKGQNAGLYNIDKVYKNNELVFEQGYTREQQGIPPLTTTHQAIGKDLKQYQVYGKTIQARLPLEYQEVEWIKADLNSWINTRIKPKYDETRVIFDGYETASRSLFGAKSRYFGVTGVSSGQKIRFDYNNSVYTSDYTFTERHKWELNKNTAYVDGTLVKTFTSSSTQDALNMYLFARNYNNTGDDTSNGYCYSCKIYTNDTLVRDFVPCYSKEVVTDVDGNTQPSGTIGMYDLVNNAFYVNKGTGAFSKGNDIEPTPNVNNPVAIESVGDLVTDTSDVNYGKYKIPITVSDGTNSTTTNIYLDAPLRKIGTYADYIDFQNQKVIRKVDELTITGDESSWEKVGSYNLFRFIISRSQTIPDLDDFTIEKCNYYSCDNVAVAETNIGCSAYWSSSLEKTYFRIRPETTYSSVGYFQIFVRNLYSNGKPLKIAYPRYTDLEESIVLPNVPSYSGTTTYSIGTDITPSNMYIKYKGK